jgi:hypothetical protein
MQVKQKALGTLLTELGVKTGNVMAVKLLQKRVEKLDKFVEDDDVPEPKTEESKKLLKQILKAIKNEEEIEVVASGKAEEEAPAKSEKSNGKSAKAKAEPEDDEDEDDQDEAEAAAEEDDEDEDEKPAKKSKKAAKAEAEEDDEDEDEEPKSKKKDKKGKKKGSPVGRGPGIIKRIREIMEKTTEKKPVTKEQIVDTLLKEFPDREKDSLLKTVTGQVSYFLRDTNKKQESPLDIQRNEKGYYVAG